MTTLSSSHSCPTRHTEAKTFFLACNGSLKIQAQTLAIEIMHPYSHRQSHGFELALLTVPRLLITFGQPGTTKVQLLPVLYRLCSIYFPHWSKISVRVVFKLTSQRILEPLVNSSQAMKTNTRSELAKMRRNYFKISVAVNMC